jgi:hypothetical protein
MGERYTITQQMHLLEFDRSCGFISESEFQWRMNGLRNRAAQIEQARWKKRGRPANPREEKRVGKVLLGCALGLQLLIPFTPVGEIRNTCAIEPLPWFAATLIISLLLSYIPALLVTAWTRKR